MNPDKQRAVISFLLASLLAGCGGGGGGRYDQDDGSAADDSLEADLESRDREVSTYGVPPSSKSDKYTIVIECAGRTPVQNSGAPLGDAVQGEQLYVNGADAGVLVGDTAYNLCELSGTSLYIE